MDVDSVASVQQSEGDNNMMSTEETGDDNSVFGAQIDGIVKSTVDTNVSELHNSFAVGRDGSEEELKKIVCGAVQTAFKGQVLAPQVDDGELSEQIADKAFETIKLDNRLQFTKAERLVFGRLLIVCHDALKEYRATKEKSNAPDLRVASITTGLDQDYVGGFDLARFHERIEETFEWHDGMHREFLSPSFAMIQSSGMGKTRLMKAYKKAMENQDYTVLSLLCKTKNMAGPPDAKTHFDHNLDVPASSTDYSDGWNQLSKQLNDIVGAAVQDKKKKLEEQVANKKEKQGNKRGRQEEETREILKLVLLFDEAHVLTESHKGGYYVCIRWWLRRSDLPWKVRIVAVFAGTLLSLANYQKLAKEQGWSRDGKCTYVNYDEGASEKESKLKFYDPFFVLTTIGMYQSRGELSVPKGDELFDIRRCGRHGRPLFATMLDPLHAAGDELKLEKAQGKNEGSQIINNDRLHAILRRIILSKHPWKENNLSVAAVLGTRVQMGVSSYQFASEATSSGYAMLVGFEGDAKKQTANVVFPPDPVCAALAMGLMQENWSVSSDRAEAIKGEGPEFWVKQAFASFERKIFTPSGGDVGEVFAALYMLFCGDELRYINDPFMRCFDVGLSDWLARLSGVAKTGSHVPKLNFIQVCRNYCRSHSWLETGSLRYMYKSATACYTYMYCPAVDIVFPIKIVENFHPCLVTVKCWEHMTAPEMKNALSAIKTLRNKNTNLQRLPKALCLLIVIGSTAGETPNEGSFPESDEYRVIVVGTGTRDFGISDMIATTFNKHIKAEILASHPYLYNEPEQMVFRSGTLAKDKKFGNDLLADKKKSWGPTGGPPAKGAEA